MSNQNDDSDLVKEFLGLWQKQFSYMSQSPDAVGDSMKQLYEMQKRYAQESSHNATNNAATCKFDDALSQYDKLCERIRELEFRVAKMESQLKDRPRKIKRQNKKQRA